MILISAERKELTRCENQDRTDQLRYELDVSKLDFVECQGFFEGSLEHTFLVWSSDSDLFTEVGQIYGQDSILYVADGQPKAAYVVDCSSKNRVHIGVWTEVNEVEAKQSKGYTKIGNQYYVCK